MLQAVVRKSCLAVVLALAFSAGAAAAESPARVYVILWFDTEDYLLPASDDAALRLARMLSAENIRATFKVVGEKARTLERRGRRDVIEALKKHEIGYHSNFHSVQPSPAMYLSLLGWDEGVAEFDRRERPGYEDVKRIFGVAPSCYGQPGSSWAPQSFGAMKNWGMEVYLDSGGHVGLDGRPHYFCGIFNLYRLAHTFRADLTGPKGQEAAEKRFLTAREQLLAEGGGVVSVVYHPCEFVHKQFWDGVNFREGANPPRSQWKQPPQKTEEETRIAYETFLGWVRLMKRMPEVRFVTAREAAGLYRDRARGREFSAAELKAIAAGVGDGVTFQKHRDYTLAASEVLALLNEFVARRAATSELKSTPLGPCDPRPEMKEAVTTDGDQFGRTVADVGEYLQRHGRVPSAVWLGSVAVTPEAYLVALAKVAGELLDEKPIPEKIELKPIQLTAAKYVADDNPNLWRWVIFPKGFRAPRLMELAKRQAWTIKPALLSKAAE